ncbi:MAG: hypothetical protein Q9157_001130 [Trypethelium eluteriae]
MSPTTRTDTRPPNVRPSPGQIGDSDSNDSSRSPTPGELKSQEAGDVLGTTFKAPVGHLLDADVEQLMHHLHETQLYDSATSSQKSTRYVPPDYSMQMHVDSQAYQDLIARGKTYEEQRIKKGLTGLISKKKKLQHGFDPVQVIRKHAINLPPDAPPDVSTLENEIIPLFRWENFHDCALDVYEQIKPALRLSSLLLTHRASSTFWHTLAYGKRESCRRTTEQHGIECMRIAEDIQWDKAHADYLMTYFKTLSKQIHFHFDLLQAPTITPSYTYGLCAVVRDYKNPLPADNGSYRTQKTRICLHTDFYTTAKRISTLDKRNVDPAMVLRFNFFLAVNITHEIAHFFELAHNFPMRLGEVFFYRNQWAESGCAFECKVFGGRIHPISARIDCAYGLATYDWPPHDEDDPQGDIHWTIPMEYITRIQQASTWDSADPSDPAVFFIPRTGARSVSLCALDMTMWEDEAKAEIVDETVESLTAPLRRLLSGNIVKASSHEAKGISLRRTITGRVAKVATRGSPHVSMPSGMRTRRFRLSEKRRAPKRSLRKNGSVGKGGTKANGLALEPVGNVKRTVSRSGNRYAILENLPTE